MEGAVFSATERRGSGSTMLRMFSISVTVSESGLTLRPREATGCAARWKGFLLPAALSTFLLLTCTVGATQQISPGTVLPVFLNSTLDARHDKPGDRVTGRIMQDVLLPDGARIPRGAKIVGHVVRAQPVSPGVPSRLSLTFDYIELRGQRIPISATLRALASTNEVFEARMPTNAWDDYGTSPSDWNTVQIGGAGVYRGNGEVVSGNQVVGKATDSGAVTARLMAAPDRGCAGASAREQALWKFSPWACGVYGFNDLKILNSPGPGAAGEVELQSGRDIHIDGGSGWLLTTVAP